MGFPRTGIEAVFVAAAKIDLNHECFWETKPRTDQSDIGQHLY